MYEILWPAQDLGLSLAELTCSGNQVDARFVLTAATADCPSCHLPSAAVHSYYPRILHDLPLANRPVRLYLRVRRFFCRVQECPRRIFAEPLGSLAAPYAHRTTRMADALRQIGLVLGGQAGSRLAAVLQLAASADTILRFVRLTPDAPLLDAPRFLGVDDFCWRRGQTYGTILVDLESGRVIDLLPDRSAASFAAWLQAHPGTEIISRDRASVYSEGANTGAPAARQAADRFHILKNLADALEELLSRVRPQLRQSVQQPDLPVPATADVSDDTNPVTAMAVTLEPFNEAEVSAAVADSTPRILPLQASEPTAPNYSVSRQRSIALSQIRRSERLACYEEVCRLHQLGWTQKAIAHQVNLAPKTIGRWLKHDSFPERQDPTERASKLAAHTAYIRARFEQGCCNGKRIWRELKQQGYEGGRTQVCDFVAKLRAEQSASNAQGSSSGGTLGWQLPRPRELKWLLFKPVASLDEKQQALASEICRQNSEVELAYGLITEFQELVRERRAQELGGWVELALKSGIAELESFARGVLRDFAAVYTGLELEWNNGVVEGNVNRLKLFKRQGYGRAKLDLLRKRILHAS